MQPGRPPADSELENRPSESNERLPGNDPTFQYQLLSSNPSKTERLILGSLHWVQNHAPAGLLMLSDFSATLLSGQIAILVRHLLEPRLYAGGFIPILLAYAALLVGCYLAVGLYPTISRSGPDELRRLTLITTTLTLIMIVTTYVSRGVVDVNTTMYLIAWALALFTVPLGRAIMRATFASRPWWGRKAIILSANYEHAKHVLNVLKNQPRLGIQPSAMLLTHSKAQAIPEGGVPLLHGPESALQHARENGISYAVVTLSEFTEPTSLELTRRYEQCFKHWLVVPYSPHGYSLWVRTRDLNGLLGLELTHRLLRRSDRIIKRSVDLILTGLGCLVALPLGALIALAVVIDSKGPVFYRHERLGRDGKPFQLFKFRTMVANASEVLDIYLNEHPALRAEWEATQKLKSDPRVTGLGRFLRRTSLDELPQIINVFRGEMSLVGPRPIVREEVTRYGTIWQLYQRVRPGITGQWQVSGRNDTSYEERTAMDAYYIRNWSIWLDIYLLARTAGAVVRRDGAY